MCGWLLQLYLVLAFLWVLVETSPDETSEQGELLLPPDTTGTFVFEHRWVDRGRRMVEWEGDRPRIDRSIALPPREVSTELELIRLERMANGFGFPERWHDVVSANRDSRELRRDLTERAAARGVLVAFRGNRYLLSPDYEWIVDRSRPDTLDLARQLQDIALGLPRPSQRELHRIVASMIQSLEYRIPKEIRRDRSGDEINNLGVSTPIEVLYNKWGDCDSKSLLFAAILRHFENQQLIFLRGLDHLFVGVREVPRLGDHYVDHLGVRYVLIEMTSPWPVGRVPLRMWSGLRGNRFAVIALGGNPDRRMLIPRSVRFLGS